MHLVVGLGNPGTRYAGHRHNIGFMAAAEIAAAFSFGTQEKSWQKKFQGRICAGAIGGEKILILLPETYMNESGRAVQAAAAFHKIKPENIIVLHDELALAPWKTRVKQGGGDGGHNGLKSIDAALGPDYWRVRLGIGHPGTSDEAADYVLSNFSVAEKKILPTFLKSAAAHFPLLLENNPSEFMNRVSLEMKSIAT